MLKIIELHPLSAFFFGGEETFGPDNRNYYVKSRRWPQQTSLLGMLRYALLRASPAVFDKKLDTFVKGANYAPLIGAAGFNPAQNQNFGIIDKLSPVFLLSPEGEPFFQLSFFDLNNSESVSLELKNSPAHIVNLLLDEPSRKKTSNSALQLMRHTKDGKKPYDGKVEFAEQLIGASGNRLPIQHHPVDAPDGIYIVQEKTGNRKLYEGASDDSGFYKQDMYRLKSGWSFAFIAEFNSQLPGELDAEPVQLGAERSMFRMKISDPARYFSEVKTLDDFEKLLPASAAIQAPPGQILMLSDAYTDESLFANTDFALSASIGFKHLNTQQKDPNQLWVNNTEPKSMRYNLLQRGSVLFGKNTRTLQTQLKKPAAFRNIGYNYFKTF